MNADLGGAVILGADLENITRNGFEASQLYSTSSYQAGQLMGVAFSQNDMTGWDFQNQDLTGARFVRSTLTDANFTGAVVLGADFTYVTDNSFAATQLYGTASYQARDLSGVKFNGNNLTGWSLAHQNLSNSDIVSATMVDINLSQANLTGANLTSSDLTNASMRGANLTSTDLSQAILNGADLGLAHIEGTDFSGASITAAQIYSTASYQRGNLNGVLFVGNNLTGWNLAGQDLAGANFVNAWLMDADFTGANVTSTKFRATPTRGITSAQLYSTESYQGGDLSGIDLGSSELTGWDFSGQDLTGASFKGSKMSETNFSSANLTDAVFQSAWLVGSDLDSANLTRANFSNATLSNVDLSNVVLDYANLSSSTLTNSNLSGADLVFADMRQSALGGASLADANIHGAILQGTTRLGLTASQLYSTASYQDGDLSEVDFGSNDLTGWSFVNQNLTRARFSSSTLQDAGMDGAVIAGASLRVTTQYGFTPAQLYSTASYQTGDLRGLDLSVNDLTDWDLSEQNIADGLILSAALIRADLHGSNLTSVQFGLDTTLVGAKLDAADARGADMPRLSEVGSMDNFIHPDGHVEGLQLAGQASMRLWDYNPASESPMIDILVEDVFSMDSGSTLRNVFEDNEWGGLVRFDENDGLGVDVSLAGTLELGLSNELSFAEVSELNGTTYQLFDWTNANVTGWFDTVTIRPAWGFFDISQLAHSGAVTFWVPEPVGVWAQNGPVPAPGTLSMLLGVSGVLLRRSRRDQCSHFAVGMNP